MYCPIYFAMSCPSRLKILYSNYTINKQVVSNMKWSQFLRSHKASLVSMVAALFNHYEEKGKQTKNNHIRNQSNGTVSYFNVITNRSSKFDYNVTPIQANHTVKNKKIWWHWQSFVWSGGYFKSQDESNFKKCTFI